jgi:catechol 2,3-dioxygenase-like lactoylglutathione lyase family enzyme
MIGYVMVGTNDLERASRFYDALLASLALVRVESDPDYVAYAPQAAPDAIEFYVTRPFDRQPAHHGNGSMIAFSAKSRAIVDRFHEIGLQNGGRDEGAPGPRPPDAPRDEQVDDEPIDDEPIDDEPVDDEQVYYAYVRDLDGNKICVFHDGTNA